MRSFLRSAILICLLFLMLGSPLILHARATKTWTVDDDGPADFSTIKAAIAAAIAGDTIIVFDGVYAEGQIDVDRTVNLVANGDVIVDGSQVGHVFCITANNVTVEGFTVRNSTTGWGYSGIRLQNVEHCTLLRNIVTNNTNGIGVGGSGCNTIRENIAANNNIGIGLYNTQMIIVEENTVEHNRHGIRLYRSDKNLIRGNVAIDNGILPGELGIGIYLEQDSDRNLVEENIASGNRWTGIMVWGHSTGNIVRNNTISSSYNGVYLSRSINNTVCENKINLTSWSGVKLRVADNNTIIGNSIRNMSATGPGLFIYYSNGSIFAENLVADVPQWVLSDNSIDNVLYHNTFINAYTPYGVKKIGIKNSINIWDNGYPSGGNYWDDHEDPDDYGGPDQNEAGSDGIVDIPYVIDETNLDEYPLAEPWGPPAMIRLLIRTISTWDLSKGTKSNLIQKLNDALHLLNQGNENGAIHKLMDFMNQVEASRDKKLTEEQADYLIAEAQKIIDLI